MESFIYIGQRDTLTTYHPFIYTNVLLKCLQIDETDPRSGKNHRRWFNVSPLGGDLNELA